MSVVITAVEGGTSSSLVGGCVSLCRDPMVLSECCASGCRDSCGGVVFTSGIEPDLFRLHVVCILGYGWCSIPASSRSPCCGVCALSFVRRDCVACCPLKYFVRLVWIGVCRMVWFGVSSSLVGRTFRRLRTNVLVTKDIMRSFIGVMFCFCFLIGDRATLPIVVRFVVVKPWPLRSDDPLCD